MARTTVNIDDALLEEAQRLLGTHGVTETINSAMSSVVHRAALDDFSLGAFDINDAELAEAAVRPHKPSMNARRGTNEHNIATLPLTEPHLVDTSAWSKARNQPGLAAQFDDSARRGHVATCELVALELLRSAQNHDRFNRQTSLLGAIRTCPVGHAEFQRARQV